MREPVCDDSIVYALVFMTRAIFSHFKIFERRHIMRLLKIIGLSLLIGALLAVPLFNTVQNAMYEAQEQDSFFLTLGGERQ